MDTITKPVIFILAIVVLLSLVACSDKTPVGSGGGLPVNSQDARSDTETEISETGSTHENLNPPPTTAPSPKPSKPSPPPNPIDPADVSAMPAPSVKSPLTYDEAVAICSAWLDNHADLTSYSMKIIDYEPEIPPPTYSIFEDQYYEFFVSYNWDEGFGYSHHILVHAQTGELLSSFRMKKQGELLTETIMLLDDWYSNEHSSYAKALLTADEAITVYNAWMEDRFDNQDDVFQYRLNRKQYDKYVLFGEQYYCFHAEESYMYWYNILVHMETGDLLFMLTSDGMYAETSIVNLDDWYNNSIYSQ